MNTSNGSMVADGIDAALSASLNAAETETLKPDRYIVNILRRAIANKQDVQVEMSTGERICLFPGHGEYYSWVKDEKTFYSANASEYKVTCLYPGMTDQFRSEGIMPRNIDEALWKAAMYLSDGRLIEPCQRDDVIELMFWPNLTRLPATPNTMSLAAFFSRYPTSITLASKILKIPQQEMFTFYSAAYCAGWIVVHNRDVDMPKLKPHKDHTLLGQLLTRISGL